MDDGKSASSLVPQKILGVLDTIDRCLHGKGVPGLLSYWWYWVTALGIWMMFRGRAKRNLATGYLFYTRWRSWLRHRATSRKVAGSIPDCVTGIFHSHNPSDRTTALGSTQPLNKNEYQEYFLWSKRCQSVWLTILPPSCAECLEILEPQPSGTLRACPGL